MTTRLPALPTVLATVLAVSGCSGPEAVSSSEEPQQAPQPRPKTDKSKAELIVGTWKLAKRTPAPKPFVPMTIEYFKDGTLRLLKTQPRESVMEIQRGTYRVEGSTLFRMMDTEPKERNVTIESISEAKLVTSGSRTGELQVHEYERIRDD